MNRQKLSVQCEKNVLTGIQIKNAFFIPKHELEISTSDHEQIKAMYASAKSNNSSYHEILGVQKGASKAEIKKAYRNACKANHPDKVAHLGESYQKAAQEKMQKINEAYDKIYPLAA